MFYSFLDQNGLFKSITRALLSIATWKVNWLLLEQRNLKAREYSFLRGLIIDSN